MWLLNVAKASIAIVVPRAKRSKRFLLYEDDTIARNDSPTAETGSISERCDMGQETGGFRADFQYSSIRGCKRRTTEPKSKGGNIQL